MYARFWKRLLDFLLALTALLVLSPLLLLLTVAGAVAMRGNPFFAQPRPGRGERIFRLIKFRTMSDRRDASGALLPDGERLNGYGRFLRKTSLDELPELFNILVGQMALVGPRPLLTAYLPLYSEEQHHRHDVRPGLTGYAQVHGRNAVPWEERFRMDVWYTQNITFRLDCRILLDTVRVVFRHDGIGSGTSETMEPFTGNRTAAVEVGAEKEESAQWAQGKD
ncbi:MAG: sugar transferase [Clostridiales bacterium]|nr:sugar transferase [Clostridiales bacterium]MCI5887181.1 sugar transferase [Oscillospiraceae bacterium]